MRWLIIVAITIRVVAAVALVAGPWVDSPDELAGWDVARFQQLADEPGRPWVDHAVEYPPGSVAVIEALAGDDVVTTHRRLVVASLVVDLGLAAALGRLGGRRAAAVYLLAGLPLVPMGLLRFDLWAAALAVAAVAALRRGRLFGVFVVLGALVKIWPALLVAGAVAVGRWRAAAAAVAVGAVAGLGWLAFAGWSLDPIDQVLTLRGATGWHVESVPGSMVALLGDEEPVRQLDAFRIGELDASLVLVGRVLTLATVAALVVLVHRSRTGRPGRSGGRPADETSTDETSTDMTSTDDLLAPVALVMVGATAALLVTAPLLSPQFLLWLTPWAALLAGGNDRPLVGDQRRLVALVVAATTLTGLVLGLYGPPEVHRMVPAAALLVRDALLVAVVAVALRAAARSGRAEHPLGQGRP